LKREKERVGRILYCAVVDGPHSFGQHLKRSIARYAPIGLVSSRQAAVHHRFYYG